MRRFVCCLALLLAAFGAARAVAANDGDPAVREWSKYRARFVADDGRVLDTGNKHVSHTEGQGWAMLFAASFGDRVSFDRIWQWTRDKLQRRDSALFAWRWEPAEENPVSDVNNASDGDILIAWGLIRAARHWNEPAYAQAARHILGDIRHKLLQRDRRRLVLLPGFDGFKAEDGTIVVNPSYYIYPAFKEFARFAPAPDWSQLRRDGLGLLAEARFGRWGLTPDWLDIGGDGGIAPAGKFPARFGFDAMRVPLYLIWAGEASPERLASYLDFWNEFGEKPIPAWTDLKDNSVAPYAGSGGLRAIVQLARSFRDPASPPLPTIGDNDDYYSASLVLLAQLARREIRR